jgi:hypothetical protein
MRDSQHGQQNVVAAKFTWWRMRAWTEIKKEIKKKLLHGAMQCKQLLTALQLHSATAH